MEKKSKRRDMGGLPDGGRMKKRSCKGQKILLLEKEEEIEKAAEEQNVKKMMLLNDLGSDVIAEILVRLPVEAVFRCKSVCKQWSDLISCGSFISQYRERWKKSLSCSLFLHVFRYVADEKEIFYKRLSPMHSHQFLEEYLDEKEQSDPKEPFFFYNRRGKYCRSFMPLFGTKRSPLHVLASSNSLLLCRLFPEESHMCHYYVCNPVTRECATLPPPKYCKCLTAGFLCYNTQSHTKNGNGSDGNYRLTCHFRVVLINRVAPNFLQFETFYSETGQWKKHKVSIFPSTFSSTCHHYENAVSCNGILYWAKALLYGYQGNIVAYDPIAESCRFIPLPLGSTNPIPVQSLGEVAGQLRYGAIYEISQMPLIRRLMIWSLVDRDAGNNVANWSLEHDVVLDEMKIERHAFLSGELLQGTIVSGTFHPLDGNVFFISMRHKSITFNLKLKRLERVCRHINNCLLSIVPYVHMPWPNNIPRLS